MVCSSVLEGFPASSQCSFHGYVAIYQAAVLIECQSSCFSTSITKEREKETLAYVGRREERERKKGDSYTDECYIPHDRQRSLVITQSSTPR